MRLIRLAVVAAGAAYLYKRFVADAGAGDAETAGATPFSSDQLAGAPTGEQPPAPAAEPAKDTLERPTWLKPADADPADAS